MISPQQDLERGLALHRAGRVKEARQCYEKVLKTNPRQSNTLHLIGLTYLASQDFTQAIGYFQRALAITPKSDDSHLNMGKALQALNRSQEAVASFRRALAIKPDNLEATILLARTLQGPGSAEEIIKLLQTAIERNKNSAELPFYLGNTLRSQNRLAEAIQAFRQAIAINPKLAEAHLNLGCTLQSVEDQVGALAEYEAALAINPNFPEALLSLGGLQYEAKRAADSVVTLQKALSLRPNLPEAWNSLGMSLAALRRDTEAIEAYRKALTFKPVYLEAFNNLGNSLRKLNRNEEAIEVFGKALEIRPEQAEVLANLGTAYQNLNQLEPAIKAYRKALLLDPKYPDAHFNLGLALLTAGDLRTGWEKYEYRWSCVLEKSRRTFPQPMWNGDCPLEGKSLLLYAEQGIGDSIQFLRYLPLLAERGAKLFVEVQPAIRALVAALPCVKAVYSPGEPLPEFDLQCSLLSLPCAFSTGLDTIPYQVPYIEAPADRTERWAGILGNETRPKIGLVWAGNPKHLNDQYRSIPLELLRPVTQSSPCRFYSLQKGLRETDAATLASAAEIVDLADQISDFSDTAAIVKNLDLVISVDTSVAHLSGALGQRTWVLLPFVPDWRWLLKRSDSPWYPGMQLFRQPGYGDWESVVKNLSQALSQSFPSKS